MLSLEKIRQKTSQAYVMYSVILLISLEYRDVSLAGNISVSFLLRLRHLLRFVTRLRKVLLEKRESRRVLLYLKVQVMAIGSKGNVGVRIRLE